MNNISKSKIFKTEFGNSVKGFESTWNKGANNMPIVYFVDVDTDKSDSSSVYAGELHDNVIKNAYEVSDEEFYNQKNAFDYAYGKAMNKDYYYFPEDVELVDEEEDFAGGDDIDEYKRGGWMYEVQKIGSPSNDMRETIFTAKNLTELKKRVIERYGTSKGFLVSRRTPDGYFVDVKFEDGGNIDDEKWQIKNNDKYLSMNIEGSHKWNDSPDMGYIYTYDEAKKTFESLEKQYPNIEIVKYNKDWWKTEEFAYGGGVDEYSFYGNCIEYIKNSESIMNNGYYLHIDNMNNYVGSDTVNIPKIDSLCLITFNSGGQKDLKAVDTINSILLASEIAKLLNIDIEMARIIVHEQTTYSKPFTIDMIDDIKNKNIIIADRDTIVCTNLSMQFADGGRVDEYSFYGNLMMNGQYKPVYKKDDEFYIKYYNPTRYEYLTDKKGISDYRIGSSFADGGGVKGRFENNYENRYEGDIWNNIWNYDQKFHFLSDHVNEVGFDEEFYNERPKSTKRIQGSEGSEIGFRFIDKDKIINTKYVDLPRYVKHSLQKHIREGQYKQGGEISDLGFAYLSELWFAVQQKDTDDYSKLAEKLDEEGVSFRIQNEVSADATELRGRKALSISEVHDRIRKILSEKFRDGGETIIPYKEIISRTSGFIDLTKSRDEFADEMNKNYSGKKSEKSKQFFATDSGAFHQVRSVIEKIKTDDFNEVVNVFKSLYPKASNDWKKALEIGLLNKAESKEGNYANGNYVYNDETAKAIRKAGNNGLDEIIKKIVSEKDNENQNLTNVLKEAISTYILEKHGEVVDWDNSMFRAYKDKESGKMTFRDCVVVTEENNTYDVTPDDLVSNSYAGGGDVKVSKSGSLEENDHITYEISLDEINPHFNHKLIGTIEKHDDEYYSTYVNELYDDFEHEEETFSNFSDAEKWVLGKLNDEKKYYIENYSKYSNGGGVKVKKIPYNSPAIKVANFKDGTHINLVKILKEYKNEAKFGVDNYLDFNDEKKEEHRMFKTLEEAESYFNSKVNYKKKSVALRDEIWVRDGYAKGGGVDEWASYEGTLFNMKNIKWHKSKEEADKRAKSLKGERGIISKESYDIQNQYAKGGGVDKRILVVSDINNGKVINDLFNQWNNIQNDKQYSSWVENVKKTKFGTYGTISINDVLQEFEFDKSPINSVVKNDFKKELNNALNQYAKGGGVNYVRPSYDTVITGKYKFVTKDETYNLNIVGFERQGDDSDLLYMDSEQNDLKSKIGGIIVKNNVLKRLSKGVTVSGVTSKTNEKGKLTRLGNLY